MKQDTQQCHGRCSSLPEANQGAALTTLPLEPRTLSTADAFRNYKRPPTMRVDSSVERVQHTGPAKRDGGGWKPKAPKAKGSTKHLDQRCVGSSLSHLSKCKVCHRTVSFRGTT